jgi:hypothetical protein
MQLCARLFTKKGSTSNYVHNLRISRAVGYQIVPSITAIEVPSSLSSSVSSPKLYNWFTTPYDSIRHSRVSLGPQNSFGFGDSIQASAQKAK